MHAECYKSTTSMCLLGLWFWRYLHSVCYPSYHAYISDLCYVTSHIQLVLLLYVTEWMTDGCETDLAEMDEGVVTCNCNHLTNFAILVVSIPSVYVCVSVCVCVCVCVCWPSESMLSKDAHTFTTGSNSTVCIPMIMYLFLSRTSAQDFRMTACHLVQFKLHCKYSPLSEQSFPSLELLLPFSPYWFSSELVQNWMHSPKTVPLFCVYLAMYTFLDSNIKISITQETSRTRYHHISHPALHSPILFDDCLCVWHWPNKCLWRLRICVSSDPLLYAGSCDVHGGRGCAHVSEADSRLWQNLHHVLCCCITYMLVWVYNSMQITLY